MKIKQFEDKGLAHYSYAILDEETHEIILIDPARDPQPYFDYADEHHARIAGVIETHPHADFVSSHLEIHQTTGAPIYAHKLVEAGYPHQRVSEDDEINLGKTTLKVLHTPGHSPDSISIVLTKDGHATAVFTGDTLFIGDVGRPDLRESSGKTTDKREALARQMYHSTRQKLMQLPDDVVVYPAHGAGTLCGKGLSDANRSTIGQEKNSNPALQTMTEDQFVKMILEDQPFIPAYFGYNVDLNKKGAPQFRQSVDAVERLDQDFNPQDSLPVVDSRKEDTFKKGHLPGAYNIQEGQKFETWLGSIIKPDELFYLVAENDETLNTLIAKAAKIGYEPFIKGAFIMQEAGEVAMPPLDVDNFRNHPERYTIVDIRNESETEKGLIFKGAVPIPLPELRQRIDELPLDKPIVVHCASGYRSAAGSSIIQAALPDADVHDLSEAVKEFIK